MDKLLGCQYLGNVYGENETLLVVVKLPDSKILRIMSRSIFLAVFILALPSVITMMNAGDVVVDEYSEGFKVVPVLLRDLLDEGLIKKGHKGFIFGVESGDVVFELGFMKDAGVELLIGGEVKGVENNAFDFVFVPSFRHIQRIEMVLKEGSGLMISLLGHDPSSQLSHYKIVYLRRFDTTVVAMRKKAGALGSFSGNQALCGVTPEDKKTALNGLEDVYLEPPTEKLKFTSRKIKFLSDLLKISLDAYPRRIFISDESSAVDWFYKNYPMRDQEFEIYNTESGYNGGAVIETGVSNWLAKNVKHEDYVVMKADARVVEEMLTSKTIRLLDELFLECKNQWAYWQCLALYGKVRDEGIAVHQWWN